MPVRSSSFLERLSRLQASASCLHSWRHGKLRGPAVVQVQTLARCNAACALCPNAARDKSGPAQVMPDDLYEHLLAELRSAGTVRLFTLMLQNEPLLDASLPQKIRRAREMLGPGTMIDTVTNGVLLTPERVDAFIGAGLDRIGVSIDALSSEVYARVRPGLPFERVVANTEMLLARRGSLDLCARLLRQPENLHEVAGFRRYWQSRGARVWVTSPTNRAGALAEVHAPSPTLQEQARDAAKKLLRSVFAPCRLPFHSLNVLANGRVILCCQDWSASAPVGDLSQQSLADVWHGERMEHYRDLLAR